MDRLNTYVANALVKQAMKLELEGRMAEADATTAKLARFAAISAAEQGILCHPVEAKHLRNDLVRLAKNLQAGDENERGAARDIAQAAKLINDDLKILESPRLIMAAIAERSAMVRLSSGGLEKRLRTIFSDAESPDGALALFKRSYAREFHKVMHTYSNLPPRRIVDKMFSDIEWITDEFGEDAPLAEEAMSYVSSCVKDPGRYAEFMDFVGMSDAGDSQNQSSDQKDEKTNLKDQLTGGGVPGVVNTPKITEKIQPKKKVIKNLTPPVKQQAPMAEEPVVPEVPEKKEPFHDPYATPTKWNPVGQGRLPFEPEWYKANRPMPTGRQKKEIPPQPDKTQMSFDFGPEPTAPTPAPTPIKPSFLPKQSPVPSENTGTPVIPSVDPTSNAPAPALPSVGSEPRSVAPQSAAPSPANPSPSSSKGYNMGKDWDPMYDAGFYLSNQMGKAKDHYKLDEKAEKARNYWMQIQDAIKNAPKSLSNKIRGKVQDYLTKARDKITAPFQNAKSRIDDYKEQRKDKQFNKELERSDKRFNLPTIRQIFRQDPPNSTEIRQYILFGLDQGRRAMIQRMKGNGIDPVLGRKVMQYWNHHKLDRITPPDGAKFSAFLAQHGIRIAYQL